MKMACSMMESNHLSNDYWVKAMETYVYIMNRCPTKSLRNKVPQESSTSMNHSVSHLNFFDCVAYAHVPYELKRKLDNKGLKCIFVGYSENKKSYKLYDPIERKLVINCDVQFVENEAWDGTIEKNIKIVSTIKHDDMTKEVVQTPHVSQNIAKLSTPMTS